MYFVLRHFKVINESQPHTEHKGTGGLDGQALVDSLHRQKSLARS